ncbi:MAG: zinc-ribbon domain-containing protein [Promethearchaeota archaeon]|nr:MAG: zinc-ribbon domain-containing protein [Candidatus Lokiarchaeota archaeon]
MIKIKYKKDQYIGGFSICALIFAGVFFYWGIDVFFDASWNFVPSFWGLFWIGIGSAILSSQIAVIANRSKLKKIVLNEFRSYPNISVEDISANTGISVSDVRAIILDLKSAGKLRGGFSETTGAAESMKTIKQVYKNPHHVEGKAGFCPNCGTEIKRENAEYCSYCGAKI